MRITKIDILKKILISPQQILADQNFSNASVLAFEYGTLTFKNCAVSEVTIEKYVASL